MKHIPFTFRPIIATATLLLTAMAQAGIPKLNYSCPDDIEVHADEGGPVYINGKEADLKKINKNYYEAKKSDVTISISNNPDGSPSVSYTGKHGANGTCHDVDSSSAKDDGSQDKAEPFKMRGHGTVTMGGMVSGTISSKNGKSYALVLSAAKDGFTCTGSFDEKPGEGDDSMTIVIHCTNGSTGSAILKGKFLTFSAGGKGGSVKFK